MTLPANINCANAFSNEGLRERSGRICLVLVCRITIAALDSCFCVLCSANVRCWLSNFQNAIFFLFITFYSHCVSSLKKIIL